MEELLQRGLDDDGLFAPKIKEHSLEKIRIHNYYVSMFSTAMREHWDQLAYVGLFSGAGRAQLSETTEYVPEQRANFRLIGDGQGIHWPDVDEDIGIWGMLHGVPGRRAARVE